MRRTLIVVAVVLAALVVIDRVSVLVVQKQIAVRAQRSQGLPSEPSVHIGGFPFLTQVIGGKYDDVSVEAHGLVEDDLRVDTVDVHLINTRLPLSQVFTGSVKRVTVDHGTGSVFYTFDDMNSYLASHGSPARLSADGDTVRASAPLLGQTVSGTAHLGVGADTIDITPTVVSAAAGALLPPSLRAAAVNALSFHFPVQGLPFGVHLQSATVQSNGVRFDAVGNSFVLEGTQDAG